MNNPFFVAEMSANHLGSLAHALDIVDAAADAGADAVKLQTWQYDTMCFDPDFKVAEDGWEKIPLIDLYREAHLPWSFHKPIFDRCKERGIECFSTPFDRESVDFLETLNCPRYKIASFEITDLPLIRYAASKGKPIILSTGVAELVDISRAFSAAYHGCGDVTLLKCTSAYPADASAANLSMMAELRKTFFSSTKVGISDHSLGIGVAVAACALGATMVEKHLTLARSDGGLDASFSMEPHEFKQMVIEGRRARAAIGDPEFQVFQSKLTSLRRSLWIVKDMDKGEVLTTDNLRTARPAFGMSPRYLDDLLGCTVSRSIKAGTPFQKELIE